MGLGKEHESKAERHEVHAFDKSNNREQPRQHPALCFGLPCDASQERITCNCVADARTDGGTAKRDAESEKGPGQDDSVISHCVRLLVVFMFQALAGSPEVNDRQQHEYEGLDEADEEHVKGLPQNEQK